MRLATYNVEWFDALFDRKGRLLRDGEWSGRYKVTRREQADALGHVFTTMDADAVLVVEAPDGSEKRNTVQALEAFAEAYGLRTREAVAGFANQTQQEIALLYDPDKLNAFHDPQPGTDEVPRFDGLFSIDIDVDGTEDQVMFSKPPLELSVRTAAGFEFRMIGAHLKSKAPHGARNPAEIMKLAIANRRKQLAQAIWLRARIKQHLEAGMPVIVLGDLNDGPGLDEYEDLFGRSSIEILLGRGDEKTLFDPHARIALGQKIGVVPTSARFWIRPDRRYLQALLDYIMVSEDFMTRAPAWRIWHPFDDPDCWNDPVMRTALVNASDHFPVTLDVDI